MAPVGGTGQPPPSQPSHLPAHLRLSVVLFPEAFDLVTPQLKQPLPSLTNMRLVCAQGQTAGWGGLAE